MRASGFFTSKKYFQRVMFSIMVAMSLILTALSVVNTYMLERSVKNIHEASNLKVLTQIGYNLSYMNEIITHLSLFAYRDNFLIPLMFSEPLAEMDYIRGYHEMSRIMQSSSFLHSLAVYNGANEQLFGSTGQFLVDGGVTKERMLNWLINSPKPHSTSSLIPVSTGRLDGQVDAFAFIVTDAYKPFTGDQSAVILYIKSNWVFDSLQKMNDADIEKQGEIYIQTSDGKLLTNKESLMSEGSRLTEISKLVNQSKATTGRQSGFAIGNAGGEKTMVTFMDGIGDWTILYVQPYDQIMKEVSENRTRSLLVTGVFLLLAVGVSVWLSYKLYDPIETMLRRLQPHVSHESQIGRLPGNELDLMSENVLRLSEKLQEISSEQIVRKYYLRKLLTDSAMFTHEDMHLQIERHGLGISLTEPIMVCVLRIDRFTVYDRNTSASAKKLYSFAIGNIAQEILSRTYICETVDVQNDHTALIVSGAGGKTAFADIAPIIREIQSTIESFYGFSLSCGISDAITRLPGLSAAYLKAHQLSLYVFAFGYRSVVTMEDVRINLSNQMKSLPADIERKLSEALKKGQLTNAGSELEKAFALLSTFQYEDMRRAVSDLAWVIKNTAGDIVSNRVIPPTVDMDHIHQIPQQYETLDDMVLAFQSVCAAICEEQRPAALERNEWIVGTIKELIDQKFSDPDLNQQSIASSVKLSSAYIGKLFKDSCGSSITEYINDVRLQHAEKLLLQTDCTVSKAMEKCGYSNQSYFFKQFKGKFGSTPKEYRIKKSMS